MNIVLKDTFLSRFEQNIAYIASESPQNARNISTVIFEKIKGLSLMPYQGRKSIYFNDVQVRDLIVKGYVITYEINNEANRIEVFGISKHQNRLF